MPDTTADIITALETNLWSQWSQFGRASISALVDTPELLRFDTPILHQPYNGVIRFKYKDNAAREVDAIIKHYDCRGAEPFWLLHPTSTKDLDRILEKQSFHEVETCHGMALKPGDLPPAESPSPDLAIRDVPAAEKPDAVLEFVAWRWKIPPEAIEALRTVYVEAGFGRSGFPSRTWVAELNGELVGKAFTHKTDGVVGVYGVVTKPETRGKGVARSLCLAALQAAIAPDVEWFVLHSTPVAVSLYKKMGFQNIAPFRVFARGDGFHL